MRLRCVALRCVTLRHFASRFVASGCVALRYVACVYLLDCVGSVLRLAMLVPAPPPCLAKDRLGGRGRAQLVGPRRAVAEKGPLPAVWQ